MISIYLNLEEKVEILDSLEKLDPAQKTNVFWVDLMDAGEREEELLEDYFQLEIMNIREALEIERSARFMEFENYLVTSADFIVRQNNLFIHNTVSFTIQKGLIITNRNRAFKSFEETAKRVLSGTSINQSSEVFLSIIDMRISNDADIVEDLTSEIATLSKEVITAYRTRKTLILKVNNLREDLMILLQNCIDKKLMISMLRKAANFSQKLDYELDISVKDLESVIDIIRFNIDRLDYIDRTLNNLITFDQNNNVKIFTIVSLFFMPPMLIASIYGMNFRFIPELDWKNGYFFALALMLLSVLATLIYFKRKKWM